MKAEVPVPRFVIFGVDGLGLARLVAPALSGLQGQNSELALRLMAHPSSIAVRQGRNADSEDNITLQYGINASEEYTQEARLRSLWRLIRSWSVDDLAEAAANGPGLTIYPNMPLFAYGKLAWNERGHELEGTRAKIALAGSFLPSSDWSKSVGDHMVFVAGWLTGAEPMSVGAVAIAF